VLDRPQIEPAIAPLDTEQLDRAARAAQRVAAAKGNPGAFRRLFRDLGHVEDGERGSHQSSLRAWLSAMATACLRFFTCGPFFLPLWSVSCLNSLITVCTFSWRRCLFMARLYRAARARE